MKCPIFRQQWLRMAAPQLDQADECIKEECAWWRDDIQMCAIKDLSLELGYTQHRLAEMLDKMPHEEQFRR